MVGEEFDLGRHFACVVVVDDGVDDGFTHQDGTGTRQNSAVHSIAFPDFRKLHPCVLPPNAKNGIICGNRIYLTL